MIRVLRSLPQHLHVASVIVSLAAVACTEVPPPSLRRAEGTSGGGADGAGGKGGGEESTASPWDYAGPCVKAETKDQVGVLYGGQPGFFRDGSVEGTRVNHVDNFGEISSGEYAVVQFYAAGIPEDIVGHTFVLGEGNNADFATCNACLVAWRACTTSYCTEGPYFATSGLAYVSRFGTAAGKTFEGGFGQVEFHRAEIDSSLHSTFVETDEDDCLYYSLERFAVEVENASNCQYYFGDRTCDIAESMADRFP